MRVVSYRCPADRGSGEVGEQWVWTHITGVRSHADGARTVNDLRLL